MCTANGLLRDTMGLDSGEVGVKGRCELFGTQRKRQSTELLTIARQLGSLSI
jgi:hypothetical protein